MLHVLTSASVNLEKCNGRTTKKKKGTKIKKESVLSNKNPIFFKWRTIPVYLAQKRQGNVNVCTWQYATDSIATMRSDMHLEWEG